ncbi:MAG: SDR family oxidoreductase, partial [Alphaproteobacteria bacterium]
MLLKGKVAVITGAASKRGLGLATARLFAEHGAKVVITDIDLAGAREAVKTLKGRGHLAMKCDVTRQSDCEKVAARAQAKYGRVDVLVNNAGITSPVRILDTDPALYDRVMDVNMRGTFHMTVAVGRLMRAQKSGSIVNMSSVSGQRGGGVFGGSAYAAAKAAILGYTKATARELGPDNIRANAICP